MGDLEMLKPIADLMFGTMIEDIEKMLPTINVIAWLAIVAIGIPLAFLGYLGLSARRISKRQNDERRGTYRSRGTYHGR